MPLRNPVRPSDRTAVISGGVVVGYMETIAANAVAGAAVTIITDGTDDVTTILHAQVTVVPSAGVADAGVTFIRNNDTTNLYNDDGTNILTMVCGADGSVTLQRTAGALTYSVTLDAIWQ